MTNKSYPTDLTDEQWQLIAPHFSNQRRYKWEKRELINAVLYINKTGCQWRMLPNDFPPYPTVWSFYRRANQTGLWDEILQALVKKNDRVLAKKQHQPMPLLTLKVLKLLVKPSKRGLMVAKRLKVVNDIFLLIPLVIY